MKRRAAKTSPGAFLRGLLLLGAVAGLAAGCGASKSGAPATQATTTSTAPASGCAAVSAPAPRTPPVLRAPAGRLDPTHRWTLTFRTSCGAFTVLLAPRVSPHATASMVFLARRGYFDGTVFHRIAVGFVIQGGDPSGRGDGGPGYTTVDKPPRSTRYRLGDVAMAKTAAEPRGAAGSQFFVMTGDAPTLPPDYAVIGHVVAGLPVVGRIGKLGDVNEQPTQPVVIERVTAAER